jgi:tight adherence protein C
MEVSMSELGLVSFLWGMAALFTVYAILAPVSETRRRANAASREEDAWAIEYDRSVESPEGTDAAFNRFIRPALRSFIPQTPMASNVAGGRRKKVLSLLVSSGNPWNLSPEEYIGAIWLGGLFGGMGGILLGMLLGFSPFVVAFALTALGAYLPRWWYRRSRSTRIDAANRSLPEGIDLLRIVMVSGQKFQSSMVEVSRRLPPGLIKDEFSRIADDLRSGRSLESVMTDFALRVPSDSVESFTRAIVQGERLGAEMTETLEAQSDSIRYSYEARIDKAIAGLETTIFLPILIGMVPAIFIIIAAPALTSLLNFL